jgi:hypothetical protein
MLTDDVRPISMVDDLVTQPIGKRDVVGDERLIIAASEEPCALRFLGRIEQTDGEAPELIGRRRRQDFARRNRIAAEQEVPAGDSCVERAAHHAFDHSVTPRQVPLRLFAKTRQLGDLEHVGELRFDQPSNGRLPDPARAGDKEKHRRVSAAVVRLARRVSLDGPGRTTHHAPGDCRGSWYSPSTFPSGSAKRAVSSGPSAPIGCTMRPPCATTASTVAATLSTMT